VALSRSLLRIRRSARAFARAPGLSFALLLTIALGVGGNAAVYGFLRGLTHPSLPLKSSNGVVSILRQDPSRGAGPLSLDEYQRLASTPGIFDWVGAVRINPGKATIDGRSQIATIATVMPNLAKSLAIPLTDGAVISHRIWENQFSSKKDVLGSTIRIDQAELRISGIAPIQLDGLYTGQRVDLWIQSNEQELKNADHDRRNLWVLARLHSGASIPQAQAALRSSTLGEVRVTPFTGILPNRARGLARVGIFLSFSAAAVFFVACTNVASFLLGRALRRSHETSLRIALGATRAELLLELFADSLVISIAGGILGLLLGMLTAHTLPVFLFKEDAERLSFAPHLLPIFGASFLCIVVTVFCGMMPVFGTRTDRPWTVLQRETGSPSKAMLRLRSGLVVGQITACCMLVLCTALLLDGLHSALRTSAGQLLGDPILITVQAQIPRNGPEVDTTYFSEVEQKTKSIAGLSPLGWTAQLPGSQPTWRTFKVMPSSSQYRDLDMDIVALTPGSLNSLEDPSTAEKMFGINDQKYRLAVVDEDAAAQLLGPQTIGLVIQDPAGLPIEIVGVVKKKPDELQQRHPTIYYGYLNPSAAPGPIRGAHFRVPHAVPESGVELNTNSVSANYFLALGMAATVGEKFSDQVRAQGRVAVINQEAADLFFHDKPLGAGVVDENGVRTEIIGVVRSQPFGTFERHAEPTIYFLMDRDCPARMTLILKDSKGSKGIEAELRKKIESVPGGNGRIAIKTLTAQLTQSGLAGLRIATLIGGASAAAALLLSILGLLSSQNDAERQRQRDRALRIALGAQRGRITLIVVKNAGVLALAGTAIGTLLSFVLLRLLMADITISWPPIQVWVIASLLPAALVVTASMLPARRASVISPSSIMRDS